MTELGWVAWYSYPSHYHRVNVLGGLGIKNNEEAPCRK